MQVQVDPFASLVALVAVGIAIWSNVIARQSATASKESAAAALRSSNAAEEANSQAAAERARTLETHDVEWELERSRSNEMVTIRNVGTSTAFSVTALVRLNDQRIDLEPGDVPSDGTFTCDTSAAWALARASHNKTVATMDAAGIAYLGLPGLNVEVRVSWQSEHGTPGVVVLGGSKAKH